MKKVAKSFVFALSLVLAIPSLTGCGEAFSKAKDIAGDAKDAVVDWWGDVANGASQVFDKIVKYSEPVIDKVKEGTQYVFDNTVHYSQEAYNFMQKKATELVGNVQDYFAGTSEKDLKKYEVIYGEEQNNYYDDLKMTFANPQGLNRVSRYDPKFEEFMPYYVSTILRSYGFEVYYGVAFLKGTHYTGLIFTNNNAYIEYQKQEVPICGFIQVKLANEDLPIIDEKVVDSGLVAVPNKEYLSMENCQEAYIVTDFTKIEEQAGIAFGQYFEFEQITDFCLNVITRNGLPANYSSYPYEIYDFDNQRVIKEKTIKTYSDDIIELNRNNKAALASGMLTNNALASMSESLEEDEYVTNIITVSSDEIETDSVQKMKTKVDKFVDSFKGTIEGKEVANFNDQNEMKNINNDANLANAIVSTAGNVLAVAGTVCAIAIGVKAGSAVILGVVVVSGASAIIYNVGNMLEGAQKIYYGVNNLEKDAVNPVYKIFKSFIKEEKTAKLVYNAWGIASGVIAGLTVPASKAYSLASTQKLGHFRKALGIIRSVLVYVVKGAITVIGAALIGNFVNKIVTYVTDSRFIGIIAGFGASLIAGIIIFKGLDKLDQKFNISGLYPKNSAISSYNADRALEEEQYTWGQRDGDFRAQSEADKEYYVRAITDMACDKLGVEGRPNISYVYDYAHPENCGAYSYSTNTLSINLASPENSTWSGLSNTIGHECRHYYQYVNWDNDPAMAQSLSNYITPDENYYAYTNQLCEVDANNFGNSFMNFFMSWLGILF